MADQSEPAPAPAEPAAVTPETATAVPDFEVYAYDLVKHPIFSRDHWVKIDNDSPLLDGIEWYAFLTSLAPDSYDKIVKHMPTIGETHLFYRVENLEHEIPKYFYFGFKNPADAFIVKALVT